MSSATASSSAPESTGSGAGLLLRVAGLPGSGKTTLLSAARARARITPISRDAIRAAMFPGADGRHTAEETLYAFDAMLIAAESLLRGSGRVALDGCCFAHRRQRDRALELARATGAVFVGVTLALGVDEAASRVESSGDHPAADRDAALVARVALSFAGPDPDDLVVDATGSPGEVWAAVRRRLEQGAGS